MKSIKSDKKCEPKATYPCLMVAPQGSVVFMASESRGTVVCLGPHSGYRLGLFKDDWNIDCLTPFNGSVCLEN